ncbi:MAG: FAD-binding domain-containing protein [Verrucomicrobiota bacterium]
MRSWEPTRDAGLRRLDEFLSAAGRYARQRNFDRGPEDRSNVSVLSPYIRHRLITEKETCEEVLSRYRFGQVEKFIQEVTWRTYWKGWLEMRPGVWEDWLRERDLDLERLSEAGRDSLAKAVSGETGIQCFDQWSRELTEDNYLHNHARMWFASIWIFTLELPWTLGADFFVQHLLDGDPASNTLSWKWVAGLQTAGKHYLARESNIEKYTEGRFTASGQLRESADPLPFSGHPEPQTPSLPESLEDDPPQSSDGLFLTIDDLNPESFFEDLSVFRIVGGGRPERSRESVREAEPVAEFRDQAAGDALERVLSAGAQTIRALPGSETETVVDWARKGGVKRLWIPYSPIGPTRDGLRPIIEQLEQNGISTRFYLREWDRSLWPYAKSGFFRFKKGCEKRIQDLLEIPIE